MLNAVTPVTRAAEAVARMDGTALAAKFPAFDFAIMAVDESQREAAACVCEIATTVVNAEVFVRPAITVTLMEPVLGPLEGLCKDTTKLSNVNGAVNVLSNGTDTTTRFVRSIDDPEGSFTTKVVDDGQTVDSALVPPSRDNCVGSTEKKIPSTLTLIAPVTMTLLRMAELAIADDSKVTGRTDDASDSSNDITMSWKV